MKQLILVFVFLSTSTFAVNGVLPHSFEGKSKQPAVSISDKITHLAVLKCESIFINSENNERRTEVDSVFLESAERRYSMVIKSNWYPFKNASIITYILEAEVSNSGDLMLIYYGNNQFKGEGPAPIWRGNDHLNADFIVPIGGAGSEGVKEEVFSVKCTLTKL